MVLIIMRNIFGSIDLLYFELGRWPALDLVVVFSPWCRSLYSLCHGLN